LPLCGVVMNNFNIVPLKIGTESLKTPIYKIFKGAV
jgi:hypothetical protein